MPNGSIRKMSRRKSVDGCSKRQNTVGTFRRYIRVPTSYNEVVDEPEAKLVILAPDYLTQCQGYR